MESSVAGVRVSLVAFVLQRAVGEQLRNQRLDRADIVREAREPRELSVASIAAKRDARPRLQVEGYREGRNGE